MGETHADRPFVFADVPGGHADPRIRAVLAVLDGEPRLDVARRWSVDEVLLDRWVRSFVDGGAVQVTTHAIDDVARRRDRFLSTFMHGLRTPLALSQMWVGLLRDSADDPEAVAEIVGHLQGALVQLDEVTLDVELLTASMLGRLVVETRPVTLAELASGVLPPTATTAMSEDAAGAVLSVDPALFRRVLRDLWSAATPAAAPAAAVTVEVEPGRTATEIRIVRTGAPLDPSLLDAMLEPFDRVSEDARVTVGLYLARALVLAHGGTLDVEQDEARTAFVVQVPGVPLSGLLAPAREEDVAT